MHLTIAPRGVRHGLILCVLISVVAPATARADVTATLTPATAANFNDRQVDAGPSAARTLTVTSTGSDPLAATGVALTGADRASSRSPRTRARRRRRSPPGRPVASASRFAPSATGARSAALEVTTYAQADGTIARTLPLCTETTPAGRRANGGSCTGSLPAAFDDPASPLDGTHRDVYLAGTTVSNAGGPARWWTDPYGGNASPEPFPGAVCQLVAPTGTAPRPPARTRVFGRNVDHDAEGVHAPN